jgi:hypothetical protein
VTEVVVTVKAGTGYDVPWLVLHGESVAEAHGLVAEARGLLADVVLLGQEFAELQKADLARAAHDLVTGQLGGSVVSVEPVGTEPTAPWNNPPKEASAPWMPQVTAPAPGGWTPPARDYYLIEVPRDKSELWAGPKGPDGKAIKGGGLRGQLQSGGIKIDWNGEEKRNTISKSADAAALDYIRSQGIELK